MQGARVLAVFESAERADHAVRQLRSAGFQVSVIGKRSGRVAALGPISAPASTLATMLMRAGISAGAARTYEAAVRGGQIVVLVHGAAKDVLRARGLLRAEQPESLERKEITS